MYTNQSGFRSNHSCETALTATADNWISSINSNNYVGTVFLDLSKAFDLVNHEILLEKLRCYQTTPHTLQWFKSYLSDRSQKVSISGQMSDAKPVSAGMPQGSVLGPVLCIIYVNDLALHLKNTTPDMFADDTSITAIGKSIQEVHHKLQTDLHTFQKWCEYNAMIPHAQKTKAMFISASQITQNRVKNSLNLDLLLNNQIIENTDSEKLLGIHVDTSLSWKKDVETMLKKCNTMLYLLLRIRSFLHIDVRKHFYNAYILPHLDDCCTVWGNCSNDLLDDV